MFQLYMRARFNYDPMKDRLLPCKETGLPFQLGDVLEIVNRDDQNWWQVHQVLDLFAVDVFLKKKFKVAKSKTLGCMYDRYFLIKRCLTLGVLTQILPCRILVILKAHYI